MFWLDGGRADHHPCAVRGQHIALVLAHLVGADKHAGVALGLRDHRKAYPGIATVGSTIVPPGLILPSRSAASIILSAIRSLTEPPGFRYSTLARINGLAPSVARESLSSGHARQDR